MKKRLFSAKGLVILSMACILFFLAMGKASVSSEGIEAEKRRVVETSLAKLGYGQKDFVLTPSPSTANAMLSLEVASLPDSLSITANTSKEPQITTFYLNSGNKYVVDFQNTIDLIGTQTCKVADSEMVDGVRLAFFQVEPSFVTRLVLDLKEKVIPEVSSDGNKVVLLVPDKSLREQKILFEKEFAYEEPLAMAKAEPSQEAQKPEKLLTDSAQETPEPPAPSQTVQDEPAPQKPLVLAKAEPSEETRGSEEATTNPAQGPLESPRPSDTAKETIAPEKPLVLAKTEPSEKTQEPAKAHPADPVQQTSEPSPPPVKAEGESTAPSEKASTVAEPAAPPTEQKEEKEKPAPPKLPTYPVNLTFREADMMAVLEILARMADVNLVAGKDVTGTVTIKLVNVPLDVAFSTILSINGYGYTMEKNIVKVVPLSQIAGAEVETVTRTFTLSYAKADDIKTTLGKFLTQYGDIEVDTRTNLIIVTDVPGNFQRIDALLPQLDKREEQVLIQVVIVDSVLDDASDLGIQWSAFNRDDNSSGLITTAPTSTNISGSSNDSVDVNLPTTADAGMLRIGTLIDDWNVSTIIASEVRNGRSKVLANPKILTLNNQTASIEIIQEVPYQDVTTTSEGGQLSNFTFKEIGTKVFVTPQITGDQHVILNVKPEQSIQIGDVGGVPVVDTRRAETTLLVKDGQSIVLAGLRLKQKVNTVTKVPLFGDIPGFRYFFRSVENSDRDTELWVFITTNLWGTTPLDERQKEIFSQLDKIGRQPHTEVELLK